MDGGTGIDTIDHTAYPFDYEFDHGDRADELQHGDVYRDLHELRERHHGRRERLGIGHRERQHHRNGRRRRHGAGAGRQRCSSMAATATTRSTAATTRTRPMAVDGNDTFIDTNVMLSGHDRHL